MNNITFGNLLEKLLYVCNQKKTSLAKKLGYDISYINKWITSKNLPSSKRINEICANISTFIIDSLDEDTYSNMIEYLEVPFDSNEEFLQNYLEDLLKETYMDTLTSNNKSLLNLPKNTHSEEYYNSLSVVKPNIIYKDFLNEVSTYIDSDEELEIIVSLNLFGITHKDKVSLLDLKRLLYKVSKNANIKVNILIGIDGYNNEEVLNTLLCLNLISTYPSLNFEIYNCCVNSNTVIFAIKDKFLSNSILLEDGECIFHTTSKDKKLVEEFYSNLLFTLGHKGKPLYDRKTQFDMLKDQTYIQYIMNNNLKCLLGSMNEFFMPPDLFMDIAHRVFGDDENTLNELRKINVFLNNVTYKSNLQVLMYESELRRYMSTGCLYFFNIPVTLSFTEIERHIEYIEKILSEPNNVEIRLVDGNFVDDFKNKDNPSLYLSKNLKFTKVPPASGENDYFIINDNTFKGMCNSLFDILWDERKDIVLDKKEDILERISKSISYIKIMSENFGEDINKKIF